MVVFLVLLMTGWLIVTFKASWFNDALLLSAVSKYSIGGMKAWRGLCHMPKDPDFLVRY